MSYSVKIYDICIGCTVKNSEGPKYCDELEDELEQNEMALPQRSKEVGSSINFKEICSCLMNVIFDSHLMYIICA